MKGRTYRYFEGTPLYPFGYGLTYGDVAVERAECCGTAVEPGVSGCVCESKWGEGEDPKAGGTKDDAIVIRADLTNRGTVVTGEVVQVYVKDLESAYAEPNARLCAFARVYLEAGESRTVELKLDRTAFTVVNEEGARIQDGRRFLVSVGLGQPDERTKELTGRESLQFELRRS